MQVPSRLSRTGYRLVFVTLVLLVVSAGTYVSLRAQQPTHQGGIVSEPTHHLVHGSDATIQESEPLSGLPCTLGFAGPYPCKNVDLLAYLPLNSLIGGTGADIWGWTDPETGKEYAVMSHSSSVSFVDISDPVNPIFVGHLPAPVPNVLWRDVKIYNNHAYIVGDGDFVLEHGLQIFDLTQLRDVTVTPTVFQETARYRAFGNAHNVAVNEETGFAYVVGSNTCAGGLHMLDLQVPASPAFAGCFSEDGYTHDAQCVVYRGPDVEHQGKEICFNSNEDTLTIVDVTDKGAPTMLARVGYEGFGYTHQGWLTEDHAYFVLGDELDEMNQGHNTHSYLWNLADLDAPSQFGIYQGPTASIDHNLYIRDGFIFEANYTSGLRILDASEIASGTLTEIAYFDTHPADDAAVFAGSWSVYPFFESGVVIVSNIEDGLYILRPRLPGSAEAGLGAGGGGWLASTEGQKLNFGFDVEQTESGPAGELKLRDKAAGVKLHVTEVTTVEEAAGNCGNIVSGANSLAFEGNGTFNGAPAMFRGCVADHGEPGGTEADQFYLACLSGCSYETTSRVVDDGVDGGNITVRRPGEDSASGDPSVLVLDPLLLSEGVAGTLQVLEVTAYDSSGTPLSGVEVTLTQRTADGTVTETQAITGLDGLALFNVALPAGSSEFLATSGALQSNAIDIELESE